MPPDPGPHRREWPVSEQVVIAAASGAMAEAAGKPPTARAGLAGPAAGPVPASWERTAAPTRLVVVRHGESELNVERRYSGRDDIPLSANGTAQARAVAARLATLA